MTSGVRRQKSIWLLHRRNCGLSASLDAALRKVIGPFALRPRSWCALKLHMCCVRQLRTRCASLRIVFPLQKLSLLTGPTDSSRGALRPSRFGFRQACRGFVCVGIPRA
nr:putative integron gene cassette protein [uncultured bacterium]